MSSLRNAVQRRNHKERAQPLEREKWGLLEKRKDYKLRAADHKTKQRKINALKNKAAERNEDEFYFGMVNSTTDKGIRRSKRGEENNGGGGKVLGLEVVKLMKTQDRGYLQTMLSKVRNERIKLQEDVIVGQKGVHLQGSDDKVIFDEDGEVLAPSRPTEDADEDLAMDLDSLDGSGNEDGDSDVQSEDEKDLTPEERKLRKRKRHALKVKQRKLEALQEQEEKLSDALDQLDHQRAKMNNTVGGVNKNGVRFKARQRKR